MYAEGDGVPKDDLRAFDYFSRIANSHADDSPDTPQSRFVANAFVALGNYLSRRHSELAGQAPTRAGRARCSPTRRPISATADAQYNLGRLYLDGTGAGRDPRQAVRWLGLAADKGQHQAQALLGHMLFKGEHVPRQAARGLMWLTLAKDGASGEKWITDLYEAAVRQASDDERQLAGVYLERYMKNRRE